MLFVNVCSETAWAIFTRFHMGPSVERVLIICSNGSAQLNNMAAMPIYGKNTKIPSSPESRKLWGWILIYSIGDTWSTDFVQMMVVGWLLTNLCPHTFVWGKYSRLPLSRIPRDSLKHFEISVLRHIRVQRVRKTINWTTTFNKWISNLTLEVRNIYIK